MERLITPPRVTREWLRQMTRGETLTVTCRDGYDLLSQKNTAYQMSALTDGRKFRCRVEGLNLTVICL